MSQTDDLDKARRYAADSMLPSEAVQATRVVDQESEQVVNGNLFNNPGFGG